MQTAVTYVGLVGTVTDLGFSALYVREGARHTDQLSRYWNNVASLKLIGAVDGSAADLRRALLRRRALAALAVVRDPRAVRIPVAAAQHALRDAAAHLRDHRDRPRDAGRLRARGDRGAHPRRHRVLPLGVRDQLRVRLRLLRNRAHHHGGAASGAAVRAAAALLVGAGRDPARHHLHHHDRLLQGRRSHPAALPSVQRGRVLHVRVQAVRVPALHPVRACAASSFRCSPSITGDHPNACCRSPRSSSRRW